MISPRGCGVGSTSAGAPTPPGCHLPTSVSRGVNVWLYLLVWAIAFVPFCCVTVLVLVAIDQANNVGTVVGGAASGAASGQIAWRIARAERDNRQ